MTTHNRRGTDLTSGTRWTKNGTKEAPQNFLVNLKKWVYMYRLRARAISANSIPGIKKSGTHLTNFGVC